MQISLYFFVIASVLQKFEEPAPPYVIRELPVPVGGEPDHRRSSDYVVFRNKAPVPGVEGIVPVVSHHEVIILCESVAGRLLSVDVDDAFRIDLEVVLLVGGDDALVQRKVAVSSSTVTPFFGIQRGPK